MTDSTRLAEALRFYADPEIYKPHPHGPAFDRRDLSFRAREALAAHDAQRANVVPKSLVKRMADRFLSWPFPQGFSPDGALSFDRERTWPIGTNLFDADQAMAMVEHMLGALEVPEKAATEEEGEAYLHGYYDAQRAECEDEGCPHYGTMHGHIQRKAAK